MSITLALIFVVLAVTVLFHYEALRVLSALTNTRRGDPRAKMLVIIFLLIAIHLSEIGFYAFVFWFGASVASLGSLQNIKTATFLDFFYFSTTTYTTVGYGDITAIGSLRIVSGVEALDGVLLLSWSASFTYLAMQKYWDTQGDTVIIPWLRRVLVRPTQEQREKAKRRAQRLAAKAAREYAIKMRDSQKVETNSPARGLAQPLQKSGITLDGKSK